MHLASKAHWASHRRQVYDLDVDAAALQAYAASVRGLLEVQCECRWPRVELYNLLYKMLL